MLFLLSFSIVAPSLPLGVLGMLMDIGLCHETYARSGGVTDLAERRKIANRLNALAKLRQKYR